MKVLVVPQHSEIEKFITANRRHTGCFYIDQSGQRIKPPFKPDQFRQWVPEMTVSDVSFKDVCERFPDAVSERDEWRTPSWGSCWYTERSWPHYYKEKFDTSD